MTHVTSINLFFAENIKLILGAAAILTGISFYYLWINNYLPFLPAS